MTSSDEFAPVRRHVAARWPARTADWHDDITSEALEQAITANPNLKGPDLVAAACAMADTAATNDFNDARRGQRVVRTSPNRKSGDVAVGLRKRHRRARPPRTPQGLVPIKFQRAETDYVPFELADLPDGETRLIAFRLIEEVLGGVIRGEPVPPRMRGAMEEMYSSIFELPPALAWVDVLVAEIERAKRDQLKWEMSIATDATAPGPCSMVSAVTTNEETPRPVEITVTRKVIGKWGNRELHELRGVFKNGEPFLLENGEQFVCFIDGERDDGNPPTPYDGPIRARRVLLDATIKLSRWPTANQLPSYVMDHELVAWLIERMGFGGAGGGGVGGTLKTKSIAKLLAHPAELVAEIENFGGRFAERSDEATARIAELRFRAMADRVRELTGL
jgi:hypothetical protein